MRKMSQKLKRNPRRQKSKKLCNQASLFLVNLEWFILELNKLCRKKTNQQKKNIRKSIKKKNSNCSMLCLNKFSNNLCLMFNSSLSNNLSNSQFMSSRQIKSLINKSNSLYTKKWIK